MTDRRDETCVGDVPTSATPGRPGTTVSDKPGTVTGALAEAWQRACAATPPGTDALPSSGTPPLFAKQDWPVGAAIGVADAIEAAATALDATAVEAVATDEARGAAGDTGASFGEREVAILSRAATGWALAHGSALIMRDRLEMLDGLLARDTSARGAARQEACRQLTALATRCSLERLEQAALVDPLTGAGNRRALETTLSRMIASAQRFGYELAVVTIDLDGLKSINDTHGHEAGDTALTSLVTAFTTTLREVDAIFRTGGDEFVVVLPGASTDDVASVMARVAALGAPSFSWGSIARKPDSDLRAEDLLAVADMDLYARRRAHRRSARRARSYHRLRLATVAAALLLVAGVLVGHGVGAPPTAPPHRDTSPGLHGSGSAGTTSGAGRHPASHAGHGAGTVTSTASGSSGPGPGSSGSSGAGAGSSGAVAATELASDTGAPPTGAPTADTIYSRPAGATSPTGPAKAVTPQPGGAGNRPAHPAAAPGPPSSPAGQRPAADPPAATSGAAPGVTSRPASVPAHGPPAGRGIGQASGPGAGGSGPELAAIDTVVSGPLHAVLGAVADIAAGTAKLISPPGH